MFQSGFFLDLGPLNVPFTILGMVVSVFVWYILIRLQESKVEPPIGDKERLSDSVISLIVAGVVLYKFWPVVSNPSLIWKRGWSVIYFSGGSYFQIGLALLIFGWFLWYLRRRHIAWHRAGQMLVRGLIPALIVWYVIIREYGVLTNLPFGYDYQGQLYHPSNIYIVAFLIVIAVIMWFMQKRSYPIEPWVLLLIAFFYIIIAPIRAIQDVFIIFDGLQWAWITVVLSVLWIFFSHRKVDQEVTSD